MEDSPFLPEADAKRTSTKPGRTSLSHIGLHRQKSRATSFHKISKKIQKYGGGGAAIKTLSEFKDESASVDDSEQTKDTRLEIYRMIQMQVTSVIRDFIMEALRVFCIAPVIEDEEGEIARLRRTATSTGALAETLLDVAIHEMRVPFALADAGDPVVNGQWRQAGLFNDKPRYQRITDEDVNMVWNSETSEWRIEISEALSKEPTILYKLSPPDGSEELPTGEWEVVTAESPAPKMLVQEDGLLWDFFEVFEKSWETEPPELLGVKYVDQDLTGVCMPDEVSARSSKHARSKACSRMHWSKARGPYGESILSWIWRIKSHDHLHKHLEAVYRSILMGMLEQYPALAGVRQMEQPYVGETILHQACAAGDAAMVRALVEDPKIQRQPFFRDDFLEAKITGTFLEDVLKFPSSLAMLVDQATPPDSNPKENGPTPLEVAVLAPQDEEASKEIVELLLKAGAVPVFYDSITGDIRFTLLHLIARSSWWEGHKEAPHMSEERTLTIVKLFFDRGSETNTKWGRLMRCQPNRYRRTPLQVAAMFGNKSCFLEMLERLTVTVSQWGQVREVGFPLEELDSAARDEEICALELMTLHKHYHLISLGVVADLIQQKWDKFGQLWCIRFIVVQLVGCCATAIVCLDDSEGYNRLRWTARHFVLGLSLTYVVGMLIVFVLCARNEEWFKNMTYQPEFVESSRISFWETLAVRNTVELTLMGVLVISPPWFHKDYSERHAGYNMIWHCMASTWFLMFVLFSLRYFELFKMTRVLASMIPEIFKRDMLPFMSFFCVIWICFAVSLRVSCEPAGHGADHEFGSFWATILTLEEAIHGPDVQWRNAVENHPRFAGFVFVFFLWVTLIMMSILIAMFSNTFDFLKEHVEERFYFRRAMFCITIEKLMPQWYHQSSLWGRDGCLIGARLGLSQAGHEGHNHVEDSSSSSSEDSETGDSDEEDVESARPLLAELKAAALGSQSTTLGGKQCCAFAKQKSDRWLLWKRGKETFNEWRTPVMNHRESAKDK